MTKLDEILERFGSVVRARTERKEYFAARQGSSRTKTRAQKEPAAKELAAARRSAEQAAKRFG
jgi:hypothetical protein